jgi:hypothetical protein
MANPSIAHIDQQAAPFHGTGPPFHKHHRRRVDAMDKSIM